MGFLSKLINKYNFYRPKYVPYDMGSMQAYAQAHEKALHELSEDEMNMFLRENYTFSKTGKIIRKYPLPDAPHPDFEELKKEADETALLLLKRREQKQTL